MSRLGKRMVDGLSCPPGANGEARDRLIFDDELPGFGVRVTSAGAKVYLLQYRVGGVRRRLTLGAHGQVTPAQARQAAIVARGLIASGQDPFLERQALVRAAAKPAAKPTLTLGELLDEWTNTFLVERRTTYSREAARAVRTLLEAELQRGAGDLTDAEAQTLIDKLTRKRPVMGRRTRDYARAMFNWGMRRRLVAANPFAAVEIEGRETSRDRVLSDLELGRLWNACDELGLVAGGLVRMLILTLQRRSEVAAMRWDEIDHARSTWTVPAARAKNGRAHIVHLTSEAWRILEHVPRVQSADGPGPFVFSTTARSPFSGLSKVREQLGAKMRAGDGDGDETSRAVERGDKVTNDWRFHDIRRTGVTRLAERGVAAEVADRLLNHLDGVVRGTSAIYQRSQYIEGRKEALVLWSDYVLACAKTASRRTPNRRAPRSKAPQS